MKISQNQTGRHVIRINVFSKQQPNSDIGLITKKETVNNGLDYLKENILRKIVNGDNETRTIAHWTPATGSKLD